MLDAGPTCSAKQPRPSVFVVFGQTLQASCQLSSCEATPCSATTNHWYAELQKWRKNEHMVLKSMERMIWYAMICYCMLTIPIPRMTKPSHNICFDVLVSAQGAPLAKHVSDFFLILTCGTDKKKWRCPQLGDLLLVTQVTYIVWIRYCMIHPCPSTFYPFRNNAREGHVHIFKTIDWEFTSYRGDKICSYNLYCRSKNAKKTHNSSNPPKNTCNFSCKLDMGQNP